MKLLLAVDGSECSVRVAQKVVAHINDFKQPPDIELFAVHLPVPHVPHMGIVVKKEMLDRYYAEECEAMLAPVRKILDSAGVKYAVKTCVGPVAECIVKEARELGCDYLFMGTHGRTPLANMVHGSVVTRVLHLIHDVPVVLVH